MLVLEASSESVREQVKRKGRSRIHGKLELDDEQIRAVSIEISESYRQQAAERGQRDEADISEWLQDVREQHEAWVEEQEERQIEQHLLSRQRSLDTCLL